MSGEDLVFKYSSATIYSPLKLSGAVLTVSVTNYGETDLTGLVFYIKPATSLGDVDYPSDNNPYTDYQDVLKWGTDVVEGLDVQGGLVVSLPQNSGTYNGRITRSSGSLKSNGIPFKDLAAGATETFTIDIEGPSGAGARRLYLDLVIE